MSPILGVLSSAWWAIGAHLWQTTLVLLAALVLGRALRSAPARLVHLMWTLAFAKLLLPLAVLGGAMDAIFARLGIQTDAGRTLGAFGTYFGGVLDPVTALGAPSSSSTALAPWMSVALTVFWFAGAGWMILRLFGSWRAARDVSVEPISVLPAHLQGRIGRAARRAGVAPRALAISDSIAVPSVIGLLSPRILLPRGIVERLDEAELRSILLHEEHHRRRRDPLRVAIISLVSSLYFFHPLVGPVRRRMQESAELLCDENVVRAGLAPGVYARALATVVAAGLVPPRRALAAGAGPGLRLRDRMERLDQPGRFTMRGRHVLAFALLVGLVGVASLAPVSWIAGCNGEQPAAEREIPQQSRTVTEEVQPDRGLPSHPEGKPDPDLDAGRLGGMPNLIEMPSPTYPERARQQGIEGTVLVRARIDAEGRVAEAFLVEGPEALSSAALDAVRAARFRPAMKDGRPVATWVQIPIRFALQ